MRNAKRASKALRRFADWQDIKVRHVGRRMSEAGAIAEKLEGELQARKGELAVQEHAAQQALFHWGPRQAMAVARHVEGTREACELLSRNAEQARRVWSDLSVMFSREHTLKLQAERLAEDRDRQRTNETERLNSGEMEDLILVARVRNERR